jgi:hypothetical protein
MQLSLDQLSFELTQLQLKQVIQLIEAVTEYSDRAFSSRVKRVSMDQASYEGQYRAPLTAYLLDLCRGKDHSPSEEIDFLASKIEHRQLATWTRDIVREFAKQERLQQLYENKNKAGWFGRKGPALDLTED